MKELRKGANIASQSIISVLSGVNDCTLKFAGRTLNVVSNVIGSGLDIASESLDHGLMGGEKSKSFKFHMRNRHNNDDKVNRVIDGRIPIEDYIDEKLYGLPSDVLDAVNNIMNSKTEDHGEAKA